jgi:ribonuclease P protein component
LKEFALPKNIILQKKKDFNHIIFEGKSLGSTYFRAFHIIDDHLKVGFAVQRGNKSKVARNYLKRKLKELWRISYNDYCISGKNVIIIKQLASKIKFDVIEKDFRILLEKLENI